MSNELVARNGITVNGNVEVTGSTISTGGFTGSLSGSATISSLSSTASFSLLSATASLCNQSVTSSAVIRTGIDSLGNGYGIVVQPAHGDPDGSVGIGGTTEIRSGDGYYGGDITIQSGTSSFDVGGNVNIVSGYGPLSSNVIITAGAYSGPSGGNGTVQLNGQTTHIQCITGSAEFGYGKLTLTNLQISSNQSASFTSITSSLFGTSSVAVTSSVAQTASHAIFSNTAGTASHSTGFTINGNLTIIGTSKLLHGSNVSASGGSHAQGQDTVANGDFSHAEGRGSYTGLNWAHAEGYFTSASGFAAHAEGVTTQATGLAAHAEGATTLAVGTAAHAEGQSVTASGDYSHAEGQGTVALGVASHADGLGTIASGSNQSVIGRYNLQNNTASLFIIGNGTSTSSRSDIVRVNSDSMYVFAPLHATSSHATSASYALVANTANSATTATTATNATSADTANYATEAGGADTVYIVSTAEGGANYLTFVTAAASLPEYTAVSVATGITCDPSTNSITATTFYGAFIGNASTATTASYAHRAQTSTTTTQSLNATSSLTASYLNRVATVDVGSDDWDRTVLTARTITFYEPANNYTAKIEMVPDDGFIRIVGDTVADANSFFIDQAGNASLGILPDGSTKFRVQGSISASAVTASFRGNISGTATSASYVSGSTSHISQLTSSIVSSSIVRSGDISASRVTMTNTFDCVQNLWNKQTQLTKILTPYSFTSVGSGAGSATYDGVGSWSSIIGTTTGSYTQALFGRQLTRPAGYSGLGIDFNRKLRWYVALGHNFSGEPNACMRFVAETTASTPPVRFKDSPALNNQGFGVEFLSDINSVRIFAHNGTTYTTSSTVAYNVLPYQRMYAFIIESTGTGTVNLYFGEEYGAIPLLSETPTLTISGGPTTVTSGNAWAHAYISLNSGSAVSVTPHGAKVQTFQSFWQTVQ